MSAENFIDTNVLIYLFDETDAAKRQCAERLVHRNLEYGSGCISYQVVQETMNVVTRKLGATAESAQRLLDEILIPLWQVNPTPALYRRGLRLHDRYAFSFYDSSHRGCCTRGGLHSPLFTEDLQHGQQIQTI